MIGRVITDDVGISPDRAGFSGRTAMTGKTVAGNSGMTHLETQEGAGVVMAGFARLRGREVRWRFAHNAPKAAIVAGRASSGYSDMVIAFYQEIGSAGMTSTAVTGCRHMIRGLGRSRYACAGRMAT
jgi:hypothetical protein